MVDARETTLAQVAVLGERGTVLETDSFVVFREILVVWLRETVCQIVQLLWQPDCLE